MEMAKIKIGERAPKEFNVVVEIPQGSAVKYELNRSGVLEVDRLIGAAEAYPYSYGFIPETLAGDGDPLDAVVVSAQAIEPKSVIACRPIGVLRMEDEAGPDEKILAVPINEVDPAYAQIKDLGDLDLPAREKIKLFFAQYKEMEKSKWSKVRDFGDQAEALAVISQAAAAAKKISH